MTRNILPLLLLLIATLPMAAQSADTTDTTLNCWNHLLDEITVTAQRKLVKADVDRLSYDVQADAQSRTATALEMLRKVPLVSVDGQGEIRVRGGKGFKIYKNGHPDPTLTDNAKDVLGAMPASSIQRIEVITDSGAKYDAEGVGTIINIVMRQTHNMAGVTGNVGANVSDLGAAGASAYLTTRQGKVTTSVTYGFKSAPHQVRSDFTDAWQRNSTTGDTLFTHEYDRSSMHRHYLNMEASFEPDTINLFTLSAGTFIMNNDAGGSKWARFDDAQGSQLYRYDVTLGPQHNQNLSFTGRLAYQRRTRHPGETLGLGYMWAGNRSKKRHIEHYDFKEDAPMTYEATSLRWLDHFSEHTVQADWTRPFARWHKLEAGAKYIHRTSTSRTGQTFSDTAMAAVSSHFRHLTQVAALYASYTYQRGALTARAGLRYEWSHLRSSYPDHSQQGFSRSLSDWVPSLALNWQINDANSLKLGLTTAIQRPGINYLNPVVVTTPTQVVQGNPRLVTAYNRAFTLSWTYTSPRLTFNLTPTFAYNNDQMAMLQHMEQGVTHYTFANAQVEHYYGINGFAQWQTTDWLSLVVNANVGCNDDHVDEIGLKYSRWGTSFNAEATLKLPWQLRATLNVGEWGGGFSSIYSHSGVTWDYGTSLQRSFLRDQRLTVTLNANRPFSGKRSAFTNYTVQGDFTGQETNHYVSRMFTLSVSYRFGSLKARVKHTDATIENNDMVGGTK